MKLAAWGALICALQAYTPGAIVAVLDPYAGTGAVLDCAVACGMRGIGVEIDEALCQAMAERWSR